MARRKIPGLYWEKTTGKGRIEKNIGGTRIRFRFTADSQTEAEAIYHQAINRATQPKTPTAPTWREAATHYLNTQTHASLERDAITLAMLDPWLGDLPLDHIHQTTLLPYINHRKESGIKSATVARDLAVVSKILTLASRVWRKDNTPWLPIAPAILQKPDWQDQATPYPLSWSEQTKLLENLPAHLQSMVLFAVNTGARQNTICKLRWEWLQSVPEIKGQVFIIPGKPNSKIGWQGTKSKADGLLMLNHTAKRVIDQERGKHSDWVFTHRGQPVNRINNTAWRAAWRNAELPTGEQTLAGPHNLRHTFARRLRMAGVSLETRKALLGHENGDITLHYSPADLAELQAAVNALETVERGTILRVINA